MRISAHRKQFCVSMIALTVAWSAPADAACVESGGVVTCTGVEPNGAIGESILLEDGATVSLADPYAGGTARLSTIVVTSAAPSFPGVTRGVLISRPDSQIIAPLVNGGTAVSTGEMVSVIISGRVRAAAANSSGFTVGAGTSVAIAPEATVEVTGSGSPANGSAAGIILTGHYSSASVQGSVRTTGNNAPGITTLTASPSGFIPADALVLVRGGQIMTLGSSSPGVLLASGSMFEITSGSITTGGQGSNGLSLVSGPGASVRIEVASQGVISARYGAAIGGSGTGAVIFNSGTIQSGRAVGIQMSGDAVDVLSNSGWISGYLEPGAGDGLAVDLGGGDDFFLHSGLVTGGVQLGSGDDSLLLSGNWEITGSVNGGAGDDSVTITAPGTVTAPTAMDLSRFSSFETLDFLGGVASVGDLTFGEIATYQPLFVRPGSHITGDIIVAGGGGALAMQGVITGDIEMYGDLSTGSARGTLSVNGDVLLGPGSTVTLVVTPTGGDALIVNGAISIDDNTRLIIAGERPLIPGRAYTLIGASGGIDGSFTMIDKAETVLGHVFQSETALQLLGTFQLGSAADRQAERTLGYVNSLLIDGEASAGLTDALMGLLDQNGYADPRALRALSPEPYATALQMAVESGLTVAASLRDIYYDGAEHQGLFTFGKLLGSWRDLRSATAEGASSASIRTSGVIGGVGFTREGFVAGGFVGYLDARQKIRALSAETESDGVVFGGILRLAHEGFTFGASLVMDRSTADTTRRSLVGAAISGAYKLHGTTFDSYVSWQGEVWDGWLVSPLLGITQVLGKRGSFLEAGGGPLNMSVAAQNYRATFSFGEIQLKAKEEAAFQPFVATGLRHRLRGDEVIARGGFEGLSSTYTVVGADRQKTLGYVRAGLAVAVSSAVRWSLSGESEIGASGAGRSLRSELRVAL